MDVLSPREQEVLAHLRTDMTTAEIADALFVSVNTVKTQLRSAYRKLGVSRRPEALEMLARCPAGEWFTMASFAQALGRRGSNIYETRYSRQHAQEPLGGE
mgnify:CR=1 FL=1